MKLGDMMRYLAIFSFMLSSLWLVACNGTVSEAPINEIASAVEEPTSTKENLPALAYIQNLGARDVLDLNGPWARIIDPYENGYYNYRYQVHENGYFKNG